MVRICEERLSFRENVNKMFILRKRQFKIEGDIMRKNFRIFSTGHFGGKSDISNLYIKIA